MSVSFPIELEREEDGRCDELGPKMLARIAKSTGLRPEDL